MIQAELAQPIQAIVTGRRGKDEAGAGRLGQLDRGQADTAGARLDQHGLAGDQAPELEQAVVGRPEFDGYCRRIVD